MGFEPGEELVEVISAEPPGFAGLNWPHRDAARWGGPMLLAELRQRGGPYVAGGRHVISPRIDRHLPGMHLSKKQHFYHEKVRIITVLGLREVLR